MKSWLVLIVAIAAAFLLSGCFVTAGYGYYGGSVGYQSHYHYDEPYGYSYRSRAGYLGPPPVSGGYWFRGHHYGRHGQGFGRHGWR